MTVDPQPSSNYRLDAPPVAAPTPESQEMVLVRRSELYSIQRGVRRAFEDPVGNASGWATTWLGIGISATVSLAALLGVPANTVVPGVIAGHGALIGGGFFLAWFCHRFARKQTDARESAADDVLVELQELDLRAPSAVDDQESELG